MHPTMTVSGLEQHMRDPVFLPSSAFPVAQNTAGARGLGNSPLSELSSVSASLTEQLTGLQQAQGVMTGYAFRDFLNYFLMQQPAPTGAIPPSAPPSQVLSTSGLQLAIQLERFQQQALSEHNGQPMRVQTQPGAEGLSGAMRMASPELHTDGSMTYTVTLIKQALRHEDLAPQLVPLLMSQTAGQIPLVQASASAGSHLQDAEDQASYSDELDQAFWEYSTSDLESSLGAA